MVAGLNEANNIHVALQGQLPYLQDASVYLIRNQRGILSADHGRKVLINGKYLTARAHKKQPGVP
jgi:hypothetical protein